MMSNTLSLATDTDWLAGTIPGTTGNADPGLSGVAGSAGLALGTGPGRYGATLVDTEGGSMGGAFGEMWAFLHRPFSTFDALDIGLLVGVIMVAIILWSLILFHIRIAAETI